MVSRENLLIGTCVLLAFLSLAALSSFTSLDSTWLLGVMLGVGVVLPQLLLDLLGWRTDPSSS